MSEIENGDVAGEQNIEALVESALSGDPEAMEEVEKILDGDDSEEDDEQD
jgi:hypothetical protein